MQAINDLQFYLQRTEDLNGFSKEAINQLSSLIRMIFMDSSQ